MKFEENNFEELVSDIRIVVSREFPFLSFVVYKVPISLVDSGPSIAYSDNRNIYIRKDIFDHIDENPLLELSAVVTHEILHIVFDHLSRKPNADDRTELWNIATDFVINKAILENNVMSNSALLKNAQKGIEEYISKILEEIPDDDENSETIYHKLLKNKKDNEENKGSNNQNNKENENSGCSDESCNHHKSNMFDGEFKAEVKQKEISEEIKEAIIRGIVYAKSIGVGNNGLMRQLEDMFMKSINWKEILIKELNTMLNKEDFSWKKLHRKSFFINRNKIIPLPAQQGEKYELDVIIDTSASISNDEIKDFVGVLHSLITKHNTRARIITYDYKKQGEFEVDGRISKSQLIKNIKKILKGYGGTDMLKAIREETKSQQVVVLTDGYTSTDKYREIEKKKKRIVWVLTENNEDIVKLRSAKTKIITMN